jgi:acetyl-CoA carboxylase biotin carboxyl carrier protein
MSTPDCDDGVLAVLRQQARLLVAEVAGPLRRIQVRRGDAAVEIEWHGELRSAEPVASSATPSRQPAPAPVVRDAPEPADEAEKYSIVSPMVGTFYRAAEPGATPFVTVGDLVEPDRVIGIVEAMKLMNEITAGQAGRVLDVLVDDGQSVEFGQALIALDPG